MGQKTFIPARIEYFKIRVVGNVKICREDYYSSDCVETHENVKLIFEDRDEGKYSFPEYSYNAKQADDMIHSSSIRLRKVFIDKTGHKPYVIADADDTPQTYVQRHRPKAIMFTIVGIVGYLVGIFCLVRIYRKR